jgi:hypothetical protein
MVFLAFDERLKILVHFFVYCLLLGGVWKVGRASDVAFSRFNVRVAHVGLCQVAGRPKLRVARYTDVDTGAALPYPV